MNNTADRFAVFDGVARRCALAIVCCAWAAGGTSLAQSAPAASPSKAETPAAFSGCVQKDPADDAALIISTTNACARLNGKFSVEKLAGHEVDLKGVLTPRTATTAASIQVDSVVGVGKSCSDVCSLRPPTTRGLQRPDSAIPGSEGGTPGAVAPRP